MADIVDLAQRRAEELLGDALAERERHTPAREKLPWPRDCGRCGDPIPIERAKAQPEADRCVDCQTLAERPRR